VRFSAAAPPQQRDFGLRLVCGKNIHHDIAPSTRVMAFAAIASKWFPVAAAAEPPGSAAFLWYSFVGDASASKPPLARVLGKWLSHQCRAGEYFAWGPSRSSLSHQSKLSLAGWRRSAANDRAHAAAIQKSALRERKRGRPGVAKPVGFATPHGPFSASDASRSMSSRRRTLCAAAFAVPPRRAAGDRAHAAAVQKSAALGAEGGTGLGVAKPVGFATPRAPFSPCGRCRKHVVEVANTLRSGATQVAHTKLIPPRGPPGIASGMPLQVGHPWHRFGRPRPRFGACGH
jgi:hypothetical protein